MPFYTSDRTCSHYDYINNDCFDDYDNDINPSFIPFVTSVKLVPPEMVLQPPVPFLPPVVINPWVLIGKLVNLNKKDDIKDDDHIEMQLFAKRALSDTYQYRAVTKNGKIIDIEGHCDLEDGDILKNVGTICQKYRVCLTARYGFVVQ